MANYNKVILVGNLTRDPELKYTPSGTAVAEFGLAINSSYTSREGEKRDEVCFVDINVFGRQAETSAQYLSKGRQALIEGRLKYDQWETQDGQKRSKLRVTAERVQFLGSRGEGGDGGGGGGGSNRGSSQNRPARADDAGQAPPQNDGGSGDMGDDDIPF